MPKMCVHQQCICTDHMQPDSTLIQGTKGGIGEGELDGMEESHKGGTKTNY